MSREAWAAAVAVLIGASACGDDRATSVSEMQTASAAPGSVSEAPSSEADDRLPASTLASGPSEFYFIVDGPLVANGPPWDCVSANTPCEAPAANLYGTIEMLDDCIVVQSSDSPPGHKSVVVFDFGVTWDEATSTILGLGPEPVKIGDEADWLANDNSAPDTWTAQQGITDVPDKVRDCMRKTDSEYVWFNTPWTQVGPAPLNTAIPSDTTAPPGP